MLVLLTYMSVNYFYAWWQWRPEDVIWSLGTGITNVCEVLCRCLASNMCPVQEQQMLITSPIL